MINFTAEYAAQSGLTGTIQAAFTTAIHEKLADANLTETQRDEYLKLSVKVANDGSKLIENLAAFIEMYTEHNEIKVPSSLSIGGIFFAPIVDYVVNGEDIAKIIVKEVMSHGAESVIALMAAATAAAAGGAAFLIVAGELAVGYFVVEAFGNGIDAEYDYIVGPSIKKDLINGQDNTLSITSVTGSATNIFRHNWDRLSVTTRWEVYTINAQERYTYLKSTDTISTNQSYDAILKSDSAFGYLMVNKLAGQHPTMIANGENLGHVYSLYNMSASEIAHGGQKELYAMIKFLPMVFDVHDRSQYESYNINSYSEKFLKDRAQYLYYSLEPLRYDLTGDVTIHYEDSTMPDKVLMTLFSNKRILFGGEGSSTLNGLDKEDHLYGMGGSDTLNGNGGNDYIEGGLGDDHIDGGTGNDTIFTNANIQIQYDEEGALNQNFVHAGAGNDRVYGSNGEDHIHGEADNDVLFGYDGIDMIYGGDGDDAIAGGLGMDLLYGGAGNDTLVGRDGYGNPDIEVDKFEGGGGFDTYVAGNGDTIMDSDRSGQVVFEGTLLTKGVSETGCKPNGDGEYRGDGGVYKLSSGKLTFTKDGTNETLTIEKFVNGALGITLTSKDPGASCPPPMPNPEPDDLPTPSTPNPNFPSPLVLDLNGDGVTSTFIYETSTYFDLDNDGVRQRTGWIQADDAMLAFDKNQDGKINNGTELFGNNTILKNGTKAANGFEALKEYDENKDGVIDAKDNIYNTLQLWQDANSDGVTDTGELHTLSELGVASINLGYTQTTDYEEQNRIFQTSSFTTTDGTTQSINDVWFATESRDTARDTTVALKETVAILPDFRGAGRAGNLSAAMNKIKIEREVA